jgi:Zn-dependent peptidase ImmA (M78 family)/DNA-binding XRE family transcriptional regulator
MTTGKAFEPKRLRLARTFLGLGQSDLAERVGVSRQFVHQLESRLRSPSADLIPALAAALLVEEDFFFQPLHIDIAQEDCNFRRLESARVRDIEKVIAHGALLAELLRLLEEDLDFPAPDFPSIKASNLSEVERAAEKARDHWGLTTDQPIVSTVRVAENAGAIVVKFTGVSEEIDALSISKSRPLIIRSSEKESPTRLRFDIGHEIGHLVLHRDNNRLDRSEAEEQAHRFSSAFLLPRRSFVRIFPRGRRLDWQSIFAIKRLWKVSAQAILRRAFDLELIDAAQYRSGNVFISKQGYRRNEPYEPEETEQPEVLRSALVAIQNSKKLLPKDVAHVLGIQPVMLGKLLGIPMPNLSEIDTRTVISLNARLQWSKSRFFL